jgi:hypothetical protein
MAILRNDPKIKIRVFLEVMGWPADGLTDHLQKVMTLLKDKSKWKITKETFAEPELIGEKTYTNHVEFEGEVPDLPSLFIFAMMYGPSVVEIINPPDLYITAADLQDILSDVISKIQSMDKDIKMIAAKNKDLNEQNAKMSQFLKVLEEKKIIGKQPAGDKKA